MKFLPLLLVLCTGCASLGRPLPQIEVRHVERPRANLVPILNWRVGDTLSMEPVLWAGDVLTVEPYTGQALGHRVVLYYNPKMPYEIVCHEVLAESGDQVLIGGFNNAGPDGWFPKSVVRFVATYAETTR